MSKQESSSDYHVSYYLRNGKERERIVLLKRSNRFTVIIGEDDPSSVLAQLETVRKWTQDAVKPVRIGKNEYLVVYKNQDSMDTVTTAMKNIREEDPEIVAHHVYMQQDEDSIDYFLTDEIFITFRPDTDADSINELCARYFLIKIKDYAGYRMLPANTYLFRVTKKGLGNPIKVSNQLEMESIVLDADPNLINRYSRKFIPAVVKNKRKTSPSGFSQLKKQWYLDAWDDPGNFIVADAGINAAEAWNLLGEGTGFAGGDPEIVIAIIDQSGFRLGHPDLEDHIAEGFEAFDFFAQSPDKIFPFPADGHGTRCAGLAVASGKNKGMLGVAFGCTWLPVRIPDNHYDDKAIIEFVEKVSTKAHVISWSAYSEAGNHSMLPELFDAVQRLAQSGGPDQNGCVICISSGDNNTPVFSREVIDFDFCTKGNPTPLKQKVNDSWNSHPSVISVAASTSMNSKAGYSNYGSVISLCAPGDDCDPCKGPVRRVGPGILTTDTNKDYTENFGGTSASAPLVAGVAALVLSANRELTAMQVKTILEETADQINRGKLDRNNSPGKYTMMGDVNRTHRRHSIWFGYGKVNAAKAVAKALRK